MGVYHGGDHAGARHHGHDEEALTNDGDTVHGWDGIIIYDEDFQAFLDLGICSDSCLWPFEIAIQLDFDNTDRDRSSLDEVKDRPLGLPAMVSPQVLRGNLESLAILEQAMDGCIPWVIPEAFIGGIHGDTLKFDPQLLIPRFRSKTMRAGGLRHSDGMSPFLLIMAGWPHAPIHLEVFYGHTTRTQVAPMNQPPTPPCPVLPTHNSSLLMDHSLFPQPPPSSILSHAPLPHPTESTLCECSSTSLNASPCPTSEPFPQPLPPPSNIPDSCTPRPKRAGGRKTHAEFSYTDINKLLNAVLHVNPYMSKHTQTKEKWQEVLKLVQENGGCIGRDWETIWNKIKNVLKTVGKPNTKSAFPRTTLGRELDSNPQRFAVLSGRIDAIAAMKKHVEQVLEEECNQVKEAQDVKAAHGHAIRDAMLTGHARKSKHLREDQSESDDSDKENSPDTPSHPSSSTSLYDSKTRLSAKRHREEGFDLLASMFKSSIEKQDEYQVRQNVANQALIEEHRRANEEARLGREEVRAMRDELHLSRESQERSNIALIDILKQGLLSIYKVILPFLMFHSVFA
ncbi:hypothetical protein K439DRAFT_1618303 [Ramaria rubella]|nr:hypothetical protein K439DRAFT_1618303 [Ramaria rubella]